MHSPLVGPATVRPLAAALAARGWSAATPDLRNGAGSPASFRRRATEVSGVVDVVVGHSGAGPFLPVIAAELGAAAVVFVDAGVPDGDGWFRADAGTLRLLDGLATDRGLLPRWHEWWPAEVLTALVPDARQRDEMTAEVPRVPRTFYDGAIPLPPGWRAKPAGYLRLSASYDDDLARAVRWGWPTRRREGGHLDLLTRPEAVADDVRDLVRALLPDHGAPPPTTAPRRIRLSRRRGWRKPPGAVVVARPSRWGNPFVVDREHSRAEVVARFAAALADGGEDVLAFTAADVRRELAGRDLACWCPLDEPCHADVLLAVAAGRSGPAGGG